MNKIFLIFTAPKIVNFLAFDYFIIFFFLKFINKLKIIFMKEKKEWIIKLKSDKKSKIKKEIMMDIWWKKEKKKTNARFLFTSLLYKNL